jgi:predicted permease
MGEVGLTVMLVVASGLLVRSYSHLMEVRLGFDPTGIATVRVEPPRGILQLEPGAGVTFMEEVLRVLEGTPGLQAVSAVNAPPFPGNVAGWSTRLRKGDSTYVMPYGYHVAPGYLDFMHIPILEGRGILPSDRADAEPVVVVSQSLAKTLWGDRSPVGETMFYSPRSVTVVGVAGDVRKSALQDDTPIVFYVPYAQHTRSYLTFVARPEAPGADIIPAMREAIWSVDGSLAIMDAGYLEDAIRDSAAEERFRTTLMSLFAGLATLLAMVGIMGVTARQVSHRNRELGIRKALGAEDRSLLGAVVGYATLAGGAGVALGLMGSFWMGPVLSSYLFGLESFDLPTYAGVGLLFLAASALTSYFPARRVLRIDPQTVLREE